MSLSGPFLFDPRAFWGDENVLKMTGDQVAVYLKALSLQWENGSIPDDAEDLAVLLSEGKRHYTVENLTGDPQGTLQGSLKGALWYSIKGCFRVAAGQPGRIENPRQAEGRADWVAKQAKQSEDGKKGAKAKRAKALAKSRDPQGTLKGPLEKSARDLEAYPSPVPVPSLAPEEEEKKKRREEKRPPKRDLGVASADIDDVFDLYDYGMRTLRKAQKGEANAKRHRKSSRGPLARGRVSKAIKEYGVETCRLAARNIVLRPHNRGETKDNKTEYLSLELALRKDVEGRAADCSGMGEDFDDALRNSMSNGDPRAWPGELSGVEQSERASAAHLDAVAARGDDWKFGDDIPF